MPGTTMGGPIREIDPRDAPRSVERAGEVSLAERYAALERSERRYRALLDAAPDAVVVVDGEGRIALVNAQTEAKFGYDRSELLGRPLEMLLPERAREAHVRHRSGFDANPSIRPMGRGLVLAGRRKDGTEFPVDISLSPIETDEGRVVTASIRDISDVARTQETLALLQRVATAANRATDVDEALGAALDELRRFAGQDVAYAFAWSNSSNAFVPTGIGNAPEDPRFARFLARVADETFAVGVGPVGAVRARRAPVVVPDLDASGGIGELAWPSASKAGLRSVLVTPVLVGDEASHALAFLGEAPTPCDEHLASVSEQVATLVGRVVERVRGEEQRRYALALERSNKELTLFAHAASHDLQEPLRMVSAFLQLLRERYEDRLDARAQRYIAHAVDGSARMQQLLKSLLEYSRLETRARPLAPTSSAVALHKATANLRERLRETGGVVTHDTLPRVLADDAQLVQLFQNLVSNALKFHGREPPEVHVRAEREGDRYRFEVEDRGIGIEPEFHERVFEMFERLHPREEYPGTGVGLAICRRIVERHGGRIGIVPRPGPGTTVFFTLPEAPPP